MSRQADFYDQSHQQRPAPFLSKSNTYIPLATSEKTDECDNNEEAEQSQCGSRRCRRKCHSARLRRILLPVIVAFVMFLGVVTMGMTFCAGGKGLSWPSGAWLGLSSDGAADVAPSPPAGLPKGTIVAYRRNPAPEANPEVDALTFLSSLASSLSSTSSTFSAERTSDDGLVKRQSSGAPSGNNEESAFTSRKLYLIVIFVGLFVVLILGIMLSAWCCRSSFENPLCCPCYLCACCGGLACLQCIGCGLCCEGLDELTD